MSKADNPFRYFHSPPEVIRAVVMLYVRYPLSLRNVEDLLFERGYDLCHETVRRRCQVNFCGTRLTPDPTFHPFAADAVFHSAMAADRKCRIVFRVVR